MRASDNFMNAWNKKGTPFKLLLQAILHRKRSLYLCTWRYPHSVQNQAGICRCRIQCDCRTYVHNYGCPRIRLYLKRRKWLSVKYIFKDHTKLGKLCGIKNILSPKNYGLHLPHPRAHPPAFFKVSCWSFPIPTENKVNTTEKRKTMTRPRVKPRLLSLKSGAQTIGPSVP